jgi:hypothetical protein
LIRINDDLARSLSGRGRSSRPQLTAEDLKLLQEEAQRNNRMA